MNGADEDSLEPVDLDSDVAGVVAERIEHASMRALLSAVEDAGARRDAQELSAVMQTLRSIMQQHSSSAEDVIYPLADALSGGRAGDLLQALESRPPVAARA